MHQFSHAKMKKQLKLMIAGIKIKNFLAPILNLNNKQHSSREKKESNYHFMISNHAICQWIPHIKIS